VTLPQEAFPRPGDFDWRSWRVKVDVVTKECRCKTHTYRRMDELLTPPQIFPRTKAGYAEQAKIQIEYTKLAVEMNDIFKLIPDTMWPKCKDPKY